MKLGTHIQLADGRKGTVVYNSLDGVGIKWGIHYPSPEDFTGTHGGLFGSERVPDDWPWYADAMLRDSYRGCDPNLEYVGTGYAVLEEDNDGNG